MRELGWSTAARARNVLAPPALLAGALRHQRTVRGHRVAVYCITFDRTGRRVITGSDDRLVKACPFLARCGRGRGGCVAENCSPRVPGLVVLVP